MTNTFTTHRTTGENAEAERWVRERKAGNCQKGGRVVFWRNNGWNRANRLSRFALKRFSIFLVEEFTPG